MKNEPELYKPAEACRIAEVAPYVLRYWETEFPALAEGKDKGPSRLYTGRDVQVIRRIRELLYDEGFTVAGAKKRLEAEISEGRFEEGLQSAPPPKEQKRATSSTAASPPPSPSSAARPTPVVESGETSFLSDIPLTGTPRSTGQTAKPSAGASAEFQEKKRVVKELKDIVRLLDRAGRKTR